MAVTTNSYTSEKITQGRSFYVNNKLNDEPEREKAEAVIWNGMYMLALPNGHVYALDGRQNKTYRSAALGDYVYEGYYFENIPCLLLAQPASGRGGNRCISERRTGESASSTRTSRT